MQDIESRQDIELLVDEFYKKAVPDPVIGSFFTQVVDFSWDVHIPVMVSFWETVLLHSMSYNGNPMIKHMELNKLRPMEPHHFERWLKLWEETVSENFKGSKADEAISRAKTIAQIIGSKIA